MSAEPDQSQPSLALQYLPQSWFPQVVTLTRKSQQVTWLTQIALLLFAFIHSIGCEMHQNGFEDVCGPLCKLNHEIRLSGCSTTCSPSLPKKCGDLT